MFAGAQAQASAQQGVLLPRERHKAAYQAALVQRFRHLPDVKRIERHRHLPAALYKARPWPAHNRPGIPRVADITLWESPFTTTVLASCVSDNSLCVNALLTAKHVPAWTRMRLKHIPA